MTSISVVIPTIVGREADYLRCVQAYRERSTHTLQLITIRDRPTCGQAWNEGAEEATGDYLHFTADDLEPAAGWDTAAVEAVDRGALPAPRIVNAETGALDSCGEHGVEMPDWALVQMSVIPFMSKAQWAQIGPVLPIHYFSDNYVSWRGMRAGYPTVVRRGFAFTHHWAKPGRGAGMTYRQRMIHDRATFMSAINQPAVV